MTEFPRDRDPDGGMTLTIRLTAEQAELAGSDVRSMINDLHEAVDALIEIRAGGWDQLAESPYDEGNPGALQRRRMEDTVSALDQNLIPALEAIRATAIRSWRAQGASLADLAAAMGLSSRSTAQSRWQKLERTPPNRWERWVREGGLSPYWNVPRPADGRCDRASVGVLVTDEAGRLLMIERGTFPTGIAPVAGHLDDHGDPERAARAEVAEEVGLEVVELTQVTGGWRPNRCRRKVVGKAPAGHHWSVYRASVTGELAPSPRETRAVRWLEAAEVQELVDRTAAYARGELSEAEFGRAPGIEPVWVWWLHALGMVNIAEEDLALTENLTEQPPA